MTTKLAMLRSLVPASRRKTAGFRIALAAALFLIVIVYHTVTVSSAQSGKGWTLKTLQLPDKGPIISDSKTSEDGDEANGARRSRLGDAVMELLEAYPPSDVVPLWNQRFDSQLWHWGEPDPVNATIKLTIDDDAEVDKMKTAHAGFVHAINTRLPEYVPHRYGDGANWMGNSDDASSSSAPPKRGIVIVGGGKFNVILSVSLRFLRRTGTTLPIEIFMTRDEYEQDVCDGLFASLNATCRIYPEMRQTTKSTGGFQLKAFAMLFSSFDEILFLDADNTAMRDVGPLFESRPFRDTGLVTWPDFWQATVMPEYYRIAGTAPVPVSARPSTETGQLLIDKRRHWKTLLLVLYYNFYGASFYYRLLNQGFTGMGDKETILPAANVFGLPAYQVHMPLEKVGHRFEDGSIGGRVMIQYDPEADWAVTQALEGEGEIAQPTTEQEWKAVYHARVQPVFLHTNWPKWDPTDMLRHVSKWSDMTIGVTGDPEPAFAYPPEVAVEIRGTERMLWEEALWLACHMRTGFRHWRNNGKAVHTCAQMTRHFDTVFDTDVGKALGLGPDDALFPKLPDGHDGQQAGQSR